MTIVLAFDPGKVTGWAAWSDGKMTGAGQLPMWEFVAWADAWVPAYAAFGLEIVGESFKVTKATIPKAADAYWAFTCLGCLEWFARRAGVEFDTQSPSEAKSFVTDDKLRALGWYEATDGGHRNDACRHLVHRLVRTARLPLSSLAGVIGRNQGPEEASE